MRKAITPRPLSIYILCIVLGSAAGGEPEHPFPVQAHASIASLAKFIEAVDNFAVVATSGTAKAVKPGMISMVLRAHTALPTEGWHQDREMHILFLGNRPSPDNMIMILQADSLDAFAKGLTEAGVNVAHRGDGPGGRNMLAVAVSGTGGLVAVDIGDSRIAMASKPESVAIAIEHLDSGAWRPAHDPGVDMTVTFPLAGYGSSENPMRQAMAELSRNRYAMLAELEKSKIDPRYGEALLAILEKRLPAMGEEMARIRAVAVDCRFSPDALGVGVRIAADPGTFFDRLAAAMEKLENVDDSLLRRAGGSALAVGAGGAPARIIPDFRDRLEELAADFREKIAAGDGTPSPAVKALLSIADKEWAFAGSAGDGGVRGFLYVAEPVADFLASWTELVGCVNSLAADAITDPALGIDIASANVSSGGEKDGGREYRVTFRNPAHIDTLFQFMRMGDPAFAMTRESVEGRRLLISGDGEHTVIGLEAAGAATTPNGREPGAANLLEAPSLPRILDLLPNRQAGFALTDSDNLLQMIFMRMLQEMIAGMDPAHAALHVEGLARALPSMRKTGEPLGVGIGARNGHPVLEVAIPYRVVGAALANYDIFVTASSHDSH